MKEYKKSVEDEIDWKIVDQLHAATSTFSTSSIELKRIYLTLIVIAIPTIVKLSGDKLNLSLFNTLIILTMTFWYLDSYTFFFQEKLREKIDKKFKSIRLRNITLADNNPEDEIEDTLENSRTSEGRFWRSVFNRSVIIYPIFLGLNIVGLILLHYTIIG